MLLSATPLCNRPEDLLNQLLLFQNSQSCTIDGIPNLKGFFSGYILDYKRLMRERDQRDVTSEVDKTNYMKRIITAQKAVIIF